MLIGTYYHTLEDKGRLSLPKKFRQESDSWVVTRGLDGCLFLFTSETFALEMNKIQRGSFTKKSNRDFTRLMASEAHELEADKNGRVQLPEYLINKADLQKNVVITGNLGHIEIWEREKYHLYLEDLEKSAESIAEAFEESKQ